MTMSDHDVRIFNLIEDYAAGKDFHLSTTAPERLRHETREVHVRQGSLDENRKHI